MMYQKFDWVDLVFFSFLFFILGLIVMQIYDNQETNLEYDYIWQQPAPAWCFEIQEIGTLIHQENYCAYDVEKQTVFCKRYGRWVELPPNHGKEVLNELPIDDGHLWHSIEVK